MSPGDDCFRRRAGHVSSRSSTCCARRPASLSLSPMARGRWFLSRTSDEAITRSRQFERSQVRLAGERKMLPIPGFDMGNSPVEFTSEAVNGRTVFITTTNGTRALLALQGARDIVVASYVNLSAFRHAAGRGPRPMTFRLSARATEGHFSLEDAACAGRYVRSITQPGSSIDAQRRRAGVRAHRREVWRQHRGNLQGLVPRTSARGSRVRGRPRRLCCSGFAPCCPHLPGSTDHPTRT